MLEPAELRNRERAALRSLLRLGTDAFRGSAESTKPPTGGNRRGVSDVRLAATYSPTGGPAVPSALWGLTVVFGMGTSVTPTLAPPTIIMRGPGAEGASEYSGEESRERRMP